MSTPTATPNGAQGQQALPFIPFSRPLPQEMSGSPATYALSKEIKFESVAGDEGLAEALILLINLPITPTIATGNAMKFSPLRSFLPRVRVSQGGQTFRDIHPYFYSLRRAVMRKLQQVNYLNVALGEDWFQQVYAAAKLPPSSLPTLTTATAATVQFAYVIPFRWLRGSSAGMFPIGDSTTPLQVSVFTPTDLAGSDPEANPIILTAGSSDTVAINTGATITALLWYRQPLVYSPPGTVQTPVVGTQLMHTMNSIAMNAVGGDNTVSHKNLYPHTMLFTLVEDGEGDAKATTGQGTSLGMLQASQVARYRFRLTSTDPVDDLQTANEILAWMLGWRTQLGFDLPDGIWPYVPLLGEAGSGLYTDQDLEMLHQFPNFATWQNAQTIINLVSGTSLNGSGTGLSRISEWAEYLVSVPY